MSEKVNSLGNSILSLAKQHLEKKRAEFDSKPIGSKELFEEEKLKELEQSINELERAIIE